MKFLFKVLIFAYALLWLTPAVFCQGSDKKSFESRMYSITQFNNFGLNQEKFATLSDADKASLLASRDVLVELLGTLETKTQISQYVTPELARKYKDSAGLAASLVAPETSLMAAGVADFSLSADGREVHLHFFAISYSEGMIVASEKSAILRMVDSAWRVAGFD
jgi:hypothetical protein